MGATAEEYSHEFVSGSSQVDGHQKATFLEQALRHLSDDPEASIYVFPVFRGRVSWVDPFLPSSDEHVKHELMRRYGVEELPDFGEANGYLVVHETQFRQADHEERKEGRMKSLANFHKLRDWVLSSPEHQACMFGD